MTTRVTKPGMSMALAFALCLLAACADTNVTPKPRGYPRIDFPERDGYKTYAPNDCPFSFEYPAYAQAMRDSSFFGHAPENPCWTDIQIPSLNAAVHLSYKPVQGSIDTLYALINDAYTMNAKHMRVADYMEDSVFHNPSGVNGVYYFVGGNAASSTQFFLTDSTNHFIWGSLYINAEVNEDSLAPIVGFVRKDIDHLLKTFRWR